MRIGIDASRAFLSRRTGIEEYSYQVIRHLRDQLNDAVVILYVRKRICFQNGQFKVLLPAIDFDLPPQWKVRGLWAPRFWTQIRLSLEMLFHSPDVLFVPAHTLPFIHPKKTVVTVHGLEYEFSPESYSLWERLYMRWSIRHSVRVAEQVIAVSENTKRDLIQHYHVAEEKIAVVYEGCMVSEDNPSESKTAGPKPPYFFFIGRLETRKNILGIIEAFELFKEKTGLAHELVLGGKPGYGYEAIKRGLQASKYTAQIHEIGYIDETEKWQWLRGAEVFLFPSLYEGLGLPVIEAQRARVPVITSAVSSLPEIAGEGAILVDPHASDAMAIAMERLVRDQGKRADIIEKATKNLDRFGWKKCAEKLAAQLMN